MALIFHTKDGIPSHYQSASFKPTGLHANIDAIGKIVSLTGNNDLLDSSLLIVTSFSINGKTRHEFQYTLSEEIFLYTFGDEIMKIDIGGMLLVRACKGKMTSGFTKIIDSYKDYRITPSNIQKVIISLLGDGKTHTFKGYLTKFETNLASTKEGFIGAFSLTIETIPNF